jgi:hypothetical protein
MFPVVLLRFVIVPVAAVRLAIVVVANVEVPVTTNVLVVVLFVVVRLVMNAVTALRIFEKKLDEVAFVVDAFVEKKLVAVAFPRTDVVNRPFDAKKLVEVLFVVDAFVDTRFVVVALVILPFVAKRLIAVKADDEAFTKVACPVTPKVPATPNVYADVVAPTPTFPLARIEKSDTPVEDATLNGLSAVDVDDCTLNANVDDVALIPATTPLSRSVDVPRVVGVSQRVA